MSDDLKTLLTQSSTESAEKSAESTDDKIRTVFHYHTETKHNFNRFARSLGYMDWATQPDPFRRYTGAPTLLLPFTETDNTPAYSKLFEGQVSPSNVSTETIGQLFERSLGLSAWKEFRDSRWALRVNPSSGNLHPTEGYLVIGATDITNAPMVCHYAPKEHCLEVRSKFADDLWLELMSDFPVGSFLVGLSSIHWREAWKYGERAFRYCQHDIGHALAALRFSAAVLGWRLVVLEGLGDSDTAKLLGLNRDEDFIDAEREHPDLLAAIIPTASTSKIPLSLPRSTIDKIAEGDWFGKANSLSSDHHDWPIIDEVAAVCFKPRTDLRSTIELLPIAETVTDEISNVGEMTAHKIILQRRSAVAFDGMTEISAKDFYHVLGRTMPFHNSLKTPSMPFDCVNWPPAVHLCLFVHRVRELFPGLYILVRNTEVLDSLRAEMRKDFLWEKPPECPADLPLYFLAEGNCQRIAAEVSCGQDIAGDSAFSLGMVAEFQHSLFRIGPWQYRRLFWECGMIGQVLYLEAEALGIRATGIGCYFDDPVHDLFGFDDWKYQSLYHFTIGGQIEDTRLTTRPPYSDEQRKRNTTGVLVSLER